MLPLLAHDVSSELQQAWESQNIGASYFTPGVLSCDLGNLPTNPAWDTGRAFGLLSRTCMCHRPSYSSCVSYSIIAYTSCNSPCCTTTMQYSVIKFWRERFYILSYSLEVQTMIKCPLPYSLDFCWGQYIRQGCAQKRVLASPVNGGWQAPLRTYTL